LFSEIGTFNCANYAKYTILQLNARDFLTLQQIISIRQYAWCFKDLITFLNLIYPTYKTPHQNSPASESMSEI